jgi:hypothetical protein
VQDESDRHVAQDGLGTDDDIGAGSAVASVLGRGQVENGRERPGVFPQGFLGVNAFRNELRSEWLPAPAVKTLAETGAPTWAVEAFDRLRAANGGSLGGFCDVFAWRDPARSASIRRRSARTGSSPPSSGLSSWRCTSAAQSSS